jgi:eukaryotic translation initiation factor 2C
MIIGADVTHPAPGESRPSVVAVVASMDCNSFRYAGRLKVQGSRVEVCDLIMKSYTLAVLSSLS